MSNSNNRFLNETRAATRQPLARQCSGRPLTDDEQTFADALSTIYKTRPAGFEAVAAALADQNVRAPVSGRNDWSVELLHSELAALNADLDEAYRAGGYGA